MTDTHADTHRPARSPAAGSSEAGIVSFDMFGTLHLLDAGHPPAAPRPLPAVLRRAAAWLSGGATAAVVAASLAAPAQAQTTLLNVSYDPTRELYREFNEAFNAHWQAEGHAAARPSRRRTAARAARPAR